MRRKEKGQETKDREAGGWCLRKWVGAHYHVWDHLSPGGCWQPRLLFQETVGSQEWCGEHPDHLGQKQWVKDLICKVIFSGKVLEAHLLAGCRPGWGWPDLGTHLPFCFIKIVNHLSGQPALNSSLCIRTSFRGVFVYHANGCKFSAWHPSSSSLSFIPPSHLFLLWWF